MSCCSCMHNVQIKNRVYMFAMLLNSSAMTTLIMHDHVIEWRTSTEDIAAWSWHGENVATSSEYLAYHWSIYNDDLEGNTSGSVRV